MKILVLNSGSSSLKYQVIDMESNETIAKGYFERIGQPNSFLSHKVHGRKHKFEIEAKDHEEAIAFVLNRLTNDHYGVIKSLEELEAIGHRIVHGGEKFSDAVLITDEVIEEIKKCSDLAPLHNPAAVLGIEACKKVVPNMKMVAVFDTAFHQTIPKERYIYPVPYKYYEKYGVRKYGFHGTSHQYVANRVCQMLGKDINNSKIINCHLGQGASICAIQNGKSVETSMGLTPLGGITMVTRRVSMDFRDIEYEALSGGTHAKLSLDIFSYLIAQYIMKCAVAMNGVDIITFTAGVGEKSPYCRELICKQLEFLGAKLDLSKNEIKGEEAVISTDNSKIVLCVVPTNEELMIAKETEKTINN